MTKVCGLENAVKRHTLLQNKKRRGQEKEGKKKNIPFQKQINAPMKTIFIYITTVFWKIKGKR